MGKKMKKRLRKDDENSDSDSSPTFKDPKNADASLLPASCPYHMVLNKGGIATVLAHCNRDDKMFWGIHPVRSRRLFTDTKSITYDEWRERHPRAPGNAFVEHVRGNVW